MSAIFPSVFSFRGDIQEQCFAQPKCAKRLALVLVAVMCLSSTAAFFDSIEVNEQLDGRIASSTSHNK